MRGHGKSYRCKPAVPTYELLMLSLWMLVASFLFSCIGMLVKLGAAYFSSTELVFYRSLGDLCASRHPTAPPSHRALEEPLRILTANAGIDGSIVVQKIKEGKGDYGFNARTEIYENLFKAGVIDPTKVARVALENAASIAGMLLTTECVVADRPKKEEPHSHGAPDMGGMGGY